jgi:hypothetical protein
MKICPYCGKEHPDGSSVCEIDGNPLVSPSPQLQIHSVDASKQQDSGISRALSVLGFSLLSGFCGVGLANIILGLVANGNTHFKNNGDRLGFIADHKFILVIAGSIGFVAGFLISLSVAKSDSKTRAAIEKKYVGRRGRFRIYFAVPMLVTVWFLILFGKLFSFGTERGTYIGLGIFMAIVALSLFLYDRIPARLIIPISIIAWLLLILTGVWFSIHPPHMVRY